MLVVCTFLPQVAEGPGEGHCRDTGPTSNIKHKRSQEEEKEEEEEEEEEDGCGGERKKSKRNISISS